ncbi:hypothetical protein BDV96DRAFT_406594 [Lophiotrema nucula]|uniref:DUF7730 domain-containing protein n=1 Tax=Lophiotrema nucula TaxID=690887 RepID=A0A6A5ZHS7_9PLEO|nr:hypothetical protein BDV96DRAFT_406594 [Lophiotrema nucula]
MKKCKTLLGKLLKKSRRRPKLDDPASTPRSEKPVPHGPVEPQDKCLLIAKLPKELRLLIYEAVLVEQDRPMHIVPHDDSSGRVGHKRCTDRASEAPVWQHQCYGRWAEPGIGIVHLPFPPSDDQLLSLPLTCRLMYLDALGILYDRTEFSFKGARGIIALNSQIPIQNWHLMRRLHISTMFLTPTTYWSWRENMPPESPGKWLTACEALHNLHHLRSLSLDLILRDTFHREDPEAIDNASWIYVLGPLKDIEAVHYLIELNFIPPEPVLRTLTPYSFCLTQRLRPYKRSAFCV